MFRLLLLACVLASASAASYTLSLKGRQIPLTSSLRNSFSFAPMNDAAAGGGVSHMSPAFTSASEIQSSGGAA